MVEMKKIFFSLCMFSTLVGCNKEFTYSYLLEHPAVVKHEIEYCQGLAEKTDDQEKQCALAMQAATEIMSMLNEEQLSPEKFGQRILDTEIAYGNARKTRQASQRLVATLKNKQATATELQAAQDKLDQATKVYAEQHMQMKILLAVVGVNSPE